MRCLLAINVLKVTGEELGQLKAIQTNPKHTFEFIPDFCLTDKNKIDYTSNYLQFTESGSEIFYLFDIVLQEQPLGEEIAMNGIGDLSDDFSIIKSLPNVTDYKDRDSFSPTDYLVFDVTYDQSFDDYYPIDEWSVEVNLVGYLDKNKIFQEIK